MKHGPIAIRKSDAKRQGSRVTRRHAGPARSPSVQSYLRETRVAAAVAGFALVGGVVSDVLVPRFWSHHSLLAGLISDFIVVMLTVAVVNEAIEMRARRRWSVLAQYVMLELVQHARMVWIAIAELAGVMPSDGSGAVWMDAGARTVCDTAQLQGPVRKLMADPHWRHQLQDLTAHAVEHSDAVLGRWAAVMLTNRAYAEIIDRHVELASRLAWLQGAMDYLEPPEDQSHQRRARAHVVAQLEAPPDDEVLASRLIAIAQLAERLDRSTSQIAMRLVPREWWATRTTHLGELASYESPSGSAKGDS